MHRPFGTHCRTMLSTCTPWKLLKSDWKLTFFAASCETFLPPSAYAFLIMALYKFFHHDDDDDDDHRHHHYHHHHHHKRLDYCHQDFGVPQCLNRSMKRMKHFSIRIIANGHHVLYSLYILEYRAHSRYSLYDWKCTENKTRPQRLTILKLLIRQLLTRPGILSALIFKRIFIVRVLCGDWRLTSHALNDTLCYLMVDWSSRNKKTKI